MLPDEITRFIGRTISTGTLRVETGAIQRFAEATDDSNLLYWDEAHAKNSRYGSIIAPPGFFGWPTERGVQGTVFSLAEGELAQALTQAGYDAASAIDGATVYEFFQPVRAGDTLNASITVRDIAERRGEAGKALFIIFETTYTNEKGDTVAKQRGTYVYR